MTHSCNVFLAPEIKSTMIESAFLIVRDTYHANAGSPSMPLILAQYATSTGFDSLKSLIGSDENKILSNSVIS